MSKRNTLFKVGGIVSTALLGIAICGTKVGLDNKGAITNFLGQSDFKIVTEGGSTVDKQYFKSNYSNLASLIDAGMKLSEEIEAEGTVLLKNKNNALPLAKNSKVSLVGISSIDPAYGGRGSAQARQPLPPVTPLQGLQNAGFEVNTELLDYYTANKKEFQREGRGDSAKINDASWDRLTRDKQVDNITKHGGTAVFTITRTGGEGSDFSSTSTDGKNGDYLQLSPNEESVLKGLKQLKAEGKIDKVVLLVNAANQVATTYLSDEFGLDAALWIGSVGIAGMNAVGKILSGETNPSGHLSDTYWYNHKDNPVSKNFGAYEYLNADDYDLPRDSSGKLDKKYSTYDVYQEGVYLGYRYAETRYSDVITGVEHAGDFKYDEVISHPFGYGDSYTSFEYSNFKVKNNGSTYTVSVDVKNTGKVAGKDVVQVYVQKPYNETAIERKIEVPAVDLVGFEKTELLNPGKTQTVKVEVDAKNFTVYDSEVAQTYIINGGDYYLTAASDSHNAINNILAEQGYANKINGKGSADFADKISLKYDDKTYAVSKATGAQITNLFDDADINKYYGAEDNKVDYLSRNNWTGTLPTTNVKLTMTGDIEYDLLSQDDLSLIKSSDREYPTYGKNSGLTLPNMMKDDQGNPIPYDSELWDTFLDQLTWDQTVKLIGSGLRKTVALPELTKPGTLDHNGPAGLTEPYGKNPVGLAAINNDPDKDKTAPYYPCAGILAATFNKELAKKFGDMLGEDALWAGYNGLYGIAVNTHRSAYEGRAYEYFSEDPFLAGTMATEEVKALQAHGCNAYIKHFALNEQESQRNGVQIWVNEQTLREIYLRPFELCVVEGNAMNAMASFTRIGTQYNPACHALMTDFLRGELGMKGFVVTDMFSIGYTEYHMPTFIMAGCDLPDGDDITGIYDQFKEGYADLAWAMRESAKHVLYATAHSNAMNGFDSSTKVYSVTPGWIKTVYGVDITLGVLWLGVIGSAIYFNVRDKKSKKEQE